MLIADFFSWWYSRGWAAIIRLVGHGFSYILAVFSFSTLFRTLASPWRRIITYPGASLEAKTRAVVDNVFSRIIGFVIRSSVLLAAGVCSIGWAILSGLIVAAWPLVPLAVPACVVLGLVQ